MKRAVSLGGGGPAAGLHVGALQRLTDEGITFDVWALSCIGAWVGVVFNQFGGDPSDQAHELEKFFHQIFREDRSFSGFPTNTVFGPDMRNNALALFKFMASPNTYRNLIVPGDILKVWEDTFNLIRTRSRWTEGDLNMWFLNAAGAHPLARLFMSAIYRSEINGLARMHYPTASFLKQIKFENLYHPDKPYIYHNAWHLNGKRMELFSNKGKYKKITDASLCACSALPYIEATVNVDGEPYCEGAMVHTMNLLNLLEDHNDIEEVWIVRIIDTQQIREPKNLTDAFGNLCMMFAGSLGESDVKLFRYHAKELGWNGKIIEVEVPSDINYDWSHSNYMRAIVAGRKAAERAMSKPPQKPTPTPPQKPTPTPPNYPLPPWPDPLKNKPDDTW